MSEAFEATLIAQASEHFEVVILDAANPTRILHRNDAPFRRLVHVTLANFVMGAGGGFPLVGLGTNGANQTLGAAAIGPALGLSFLELNPFVGLVTPNRELWGSIVNSPGVVEVALVVRYTDLED